MRIDFATHNERKPIFLEQPPIDDLLFTSFLRPLSSTFITLCLFSVMLKSSDLQPGGDLRRMNSLETVSLAGNVQLINYFLEACCPKLQILMLTPYYYKESHLRINYDGLRRLLKLSSKSLLELEIKPIAIDRESTHRIKEDNKTDIIDLCSRTTAELNSSGQIESVTFDKLERLDLEIDGVKIIEYFSFNQYPRLTNFSGIEKVSRINVHGNQ